MEFVLERQTKEGDSPVHVKFLCICSVLSSAGWHSRVNLGVINLQN